MFQKKAKIAGQNNENTEPENASFLTCKFKIIFLPGERKCPLVHRLL